MEHDFTVPSLGECKIDSPITYSTVLGDAIANYVRDDEYVLYDIDADAGQESKKYTPKELLQKAGPRQQIYFSPGHVHAAIVTCGGLCPGLNDVIRAITRTLWFRYGVQRITGVRYGYQGLLPENNIPTIELKPQVVDDIHKIGGSVLGT